MFPITDAVIKQQVKTSDGMGGYTLTWSTRVSAYKCRIYSAIGMIEIIQTGQNLLVTHKCIGEYNANIIEGDALVNGSDSYRIVQIDKIYNRERIHHLEMRLKKENIIYE